MKRAIVFSLAMLVFSLAAHADYVILRDGKSYSGTFRGAPNGKLAFKDSAGIEYTFPIADVQSLVFSNLADHIVLRGGQSYSGKLLNTTRVSFRGANGIGYVFPLADVSSLILTQRSANGGAAPSGTPATDSAAVPANGAVQGGNGPGGPAPAPTQQVAYQSAGAPPPVTSGNETSALVLPSGTQISVRTDETIDSTKDAVGRLYSGRIQQDIVDSTGAVAIPSGTPAQLQVVNLNADSANQNGSQKASQFALDLHSVNLNGREYVVDSSSVAENGSAGYGMNRRTAEYAGGGAGLGALLGAVFGGGKGAGIGTLAGGGLGAVAQYMTRGKQVQIPAESVLTFQLQQTLVLHP
jgi:hypothetical protein